MAKRTPRSEASDGATETPKRLRRARTGTSPEDPALDAIQVTDPSASEAQPLDEARTNAAVTVQADDFAAGGAPSEEDIRRRAYTLYLERGAGHGRHEDDWHRAERELRKRKG